MMGGGGESSVTGEDASVACGGGDVSFGGEDGVF